MIFAMWWLILDELGYASAFPTIVLITGSVAIVTARFRSRSTASASSKATVVALLGLAAVQPAHAFLLALIVRAAFMAVSFIGLPSAALLWRERRPRRFE